MDRDRFWALVKASRQPYWDRFSGYGPAECEAHAVALTQALAELPAEEIIAFDRILDQLVWREAYSWDLWGAAYLLNGGCSDDCFVYFRYWLVGQGRLVFETAVRDPDSLAELPFVAEALTRSPGALDPECEELMYAARQAYDQATRNAASRGCGPCGTAPAAAAAGRGLVTPIPEATLRWCAGPAHHARAEVVLAGRAIRVPHRRVNPGLQRTATVTLAGP